MAEISRFLDLQHYTLQQEISPFIHEVDQLIRSIIILYYYMLIILIMCYIVLTHFTITCGNAQDGKVLPMKKLFFFFDRTYEEAKKELNTWKIISRSSTILADFINLHM